MIFDIWLLGCIIVFLVMIIDYILLNIQLGISLSAIFNYVLNIDTIMTFIGLSLGSWVMLILFVCNYKPLK